MCIISISAALGTALATSVGVSVTAGTVAGTAVAGATVAGATTALSAGAAVGIGAGAIGIGVLGIGASVAGGVMGAVQAYQGAEAQQKQAEFQAEMAENNARLAYRRAENIELQANQKRAALLMEAQQRRGSGRAGYAANGVVLGSGVTAEYEADIANAYDLDLRNLNYDVASQAWQAKVQGTNEANQAALYRAQADGYAAQKTTSVLGSAIGTVGSTAKDLFGMGVGLAAFAPRKTKLLA